MALDRIWGVANRPEYIIRKVRQLTPLEGQEYWNNQTGAPSDHHATSQYQHYQSQLLTISGLPVTDSGLLSHCDILTSPVRMVVRG
ncbi:hypothetical protein EVAR_39483_1 [Eumeta japonica]|uniref:Uncharacterized protein n=1 Tax=Eumeta variegata TaxID=151549 RepID=A0A4C1W2Q3_EUMVA|nr:hypothetical protein EVAR_39483_1 [Eumeta japonica]